jgi:invasion protein IalB
MANRFVRPVYRSLCIAAAVAMAAPLAHSQQAPAPKPPAAKPPAAAPKATPQQPAPAQPAQAAPGAPQLIYTPWTRLCSKGQDPNGKQVCFTGKDAYTEIGLPLVAVVLIEPEGEIKKILRVTVPNPVQLQYGTRIIVDQQQPLSGPYFTCFTNGCMADYDGTPDLIQKLKQGQMMAVQAVNLAGTPMSFPLPLADFAKANEGPPTDPKVFEERQKKLQEDLQKRAEEFRKKQQEAQPAQPPK